MNSLLKITGLKKRFIGLQSDGQVAFYIYANPDKFFAVARKYRIPLSSEAMEAMHKGKEFEQEVLKNLQKGI